MILEMHSHSSEHSECSHVKAAEVIRRNCGLGLQGTVLTDHHYLWPQAELQALRQRAGIPEESILLSGQEVTTSDWGDVLVFGAAESIPKGTPLETIRSRFPVAAVVWAHPYRKENRPSPERLSSLLLDAVEIISSNHTIAESSRALSDWHRYKFTATAGTDTHALSYSGTYPTAFDHTVADIRELAAEIKAGRCRPYFKEIPRFGSTVTKVTEIAVGAKTEHGRERYVIKTHDNVDAWKAAIGTERIMEELTKHGFGSGPFRIPKPLGHEPDHLAVFEQGIRGERLFEALATASPEEANHYVRMAGQWLSRLHRLRLQLSPPGDFIDTEKSKLTHYLSAFHETNSPHTRRAEEIRQAILDAEIAFYAQHTEKLVQGHGDFQPQNIYIGRETKNPSGIFLAAIDLNGSRALPPAFDTGTFIAQFRNQTHDRPEIRSKVTEGVFLQTYLSESADQLGRNFLFEIELFIARTNLNIGYYLIKIGLGASENIWRILVEAEHGLGRLKMRK